MRKESQGGGRGRGGLGMGREEGKGRGMCGGRKRTWHASEGGRGEERTKERVH